jgi:hypothetical protein
MASWRQMGVIGVSNLPEAQVGKVIKVQPLPMPLEMPFA